MIHFVEVKYHSAVLGWRVSPRYTYFTLLLTPSQSAIGGGKWKRVVAEQLVLGLYDKPGLASKPGHPSSVQNATVLKQIGGRLV